MLRTLDNEDSARGDSDRSALDQESDPLRVRRLLRSTWVWRLSGVSYPTAVLATNGHLLTLSQYLSFSELQMRPIISYIPGGSRVLDFGTGIGGNLISVAHRVSGGTGVDINPLYLRIARRISASRGNRNLEFTAYDGKHLPSTIGRYDVILSIGVFERIPKASVLSYLTQFLRLLSPNGMMILYFLSSESKKTSFVRRLGASAYVFWDGSELTNRFSELGLRVVQTFEWGHRRDVSLGTPVPVARVWVLEAERRRSSQSR